MQASSKGFTLLELLISAAMGLVLIAGFSSFYVDQRVTNQVLIDELDTMRRSRLMLSYFEQFLSQAGYQPKHTIGMFYSDVFPVATDFTAGQYFKVEPSSAGNSTVWLRYHHEDALRTHDCIGNVLPEALLLEMSFTFADDEISCASSATASDDGAQLWNMQRVLFRQIATFKVSQIGVQSSSSSGFIIGPNTLASANFQPATVILEAVTYSKKNIFPEATAQVVRFMDGTEQTFMSRQRHLYRKVAINLNNQEF